MFQVGETELYGNIEEHHCPMPLFPAYGFPTGRRHHKARLACWKYSAKRMVSQELRRGADPARIYSLAFSKGNQPDWLAVSSDKGTVHVFSLQPRSPPTDLSSLAARQDTDNTAKNPVSPISFVSVSISLPVWKFVQLHLSAVQDEQLPLLAEILPEVDVHRSVRGVSGSCTCCPKDQTGMYMQSGISPNGQCGNQPDQLITFCRSALHADAHVMKTL